MHLGIFAKTFPRSSFTEVLEAVAAHGLRRIQFNFACVGLPSLPDQIAPELLQQIRHECESRGMAIAGVSGTFNMIHPDAAQRADGLCRFEVLAPAARALGCNFISLCTGTRDARDMWRAHPDNDSPEAWRELAESMETAIGIAEKHDVVLGVEPESSNVVSCARKARQLLDEMKSPRLKIIIDPANLFYAGHIERMRETIDEAFQLLHDDVFMAHAKELGADGTMGNIAPGCGVLDWDFYFDCLRRIQFRGPFVMHGLEERDVAFAVDFLSARHSEYDA